MRSIPTRRTSGRRAADAILAAALAVALAACNYGLEGGGFPPHIRTIYIAPFTNETPQFDLDQKLYTRMLEELPRRLGVRVVGEEAADAVVTGSISRYDEVAQSYGGGATGQPAAGNPAHEVQISISVRLVDVRENVIRWESQRITGRAIFQPAQAGAEEGAQISAINNLIDQIVDGAQSQW